MKNIYLISLIILCACASVQEENIKMVTLTNNSDFDYKDAPVILTYEQVRSYFPEIGDNVTPALYDTAGAPIPFQTDDLDFDGRWDELAFVYDAPANHSATVTLRLIHKDSIPEFEKRTNLTFGVRESESATIEPKKEVVLAADGIMREPYMPYQMEGPAWENEHIGFRQYFDGRNARDIFGKTTRKMVLDTVGISPEGEAVGNYHTMAPWGMDILSVGASLGAGGLAMLHNGRMHRLGITINETVNNVDATRYRLINEGPVRGIFEITYTGWQVGEERYDVREIISIWAGKHYYEDRVQLINAQDQDTLVVGLVNMENDKPLMVLDDNDQFTALATHDKQTYNKEHELGLALILPKSSYAGYEESGADAAIANTFNAQIKLSGDNSSLTYYFVSAWGLAYPEFKDREYFREFVEREMTELSQPVKVTIGP